MTASPWPRAGISASILPGRVAALRYIAPRVLWVLCLFVPSVALSDAFETEDRLWRLIETGEAFGMIRHAIAPGFGDPADFELGSCATQRNLDATGRLQAKLIGDRFRAAGIARASVYTSQWCRCRETAELMDLGAPIELPALNSFFEARARAAAQTAALRDWLRTEAPTATPLVLVTHQVNISALTGRSTTSGEMVVVRAPAAGDVEVLGSIRFAP
ncbi:MAG: histidine phosphatase family protein [Hyphomicrobiaceae bacterium]